MWTGLVIAFKIIQTMSIMFEPGSWIPIVFNNQLALRNILYLNCFGNGIKLAEFFYGNEALILCFYVSIQYPIRVEIYTLQRLQQGFIENERISGLIWTDVRFDLLDVFEIQELIDNYAESGEIVRLDQVHTFY